VLIMPTKGYEVRSTRLFRTAAVVVGAAALAVTAAAAADASSSGPAASSQNRAASSSNRGTSSLKSGASPADPDASSLNADASAANRGGSSLNPGASAANPGGSSLDAGASAANRGASSLNRGGSGAGRESAPCPLTLNVVAHEDDDLLFLNPSVSDDIAAGRCVVTLFVTAGDAGRPAFYWHSRERGSMDAYAAMAGVPDIWRADAITLADSHGSPTRPAGSLKDLWLGTVPSLATLDSGAVFTRPALIDLLTAAMTAYRPDQIRTLDYAGRYDDGDHEDHHTVGYLTYAAQRDYRTRHHITAYMGYEVAEQPANLDAATSQTKLNYFLTYAPHDVRVCQSADACLTNFYGPRFSHSIKTAMS
jgi:LmbE family N-acetylglucosaminyl deacetylase